MSENVVIVEDSQLQQLAVTVYSFVEKAFALPNILDYKAPNVFSSGLILHDEHYMGGKLPGDRRWLWHTLDNSEDCWPPITGFREALTALHRQASKIAEKVLTSWEQELQLPCGWLNRHPNNNTLNVIRCAPQPDEEPRVYPHADVSTVTVIPTPTHEGLELLVNHQWQPLQLKPQEVVVMAGKIGAVLTNGLKRAVVHRVVGHIGDPERWSTPFVARPIGSDSCEPHPSLGVSPFQRETKLEDLRKGPIHWRWDRDPWA